jgi:hypothetical protein
MTDYFDPGREREFYTYITLPIQYQPLQMLGIARLFPARYSHVFYHADTTTLIAQSQPQTRLSPTCTMQRRRRGMSPNWPPTLP